MTRPSVRDMARVLDDPALAAMTSPGLVRRAQADRLAAAITVTQEDISAAALSVGTETVEIRAESVEKSRCSCPAPGLCRHILAALIHLRDTAPPVTQPAADWAGMFAMMDADMLRRFAGAAGLREAHRRYQAATAPEAGVYGSAYSVRLTPDAEVVLFPSVGGLTAALANGPASRRKTAIAAAALAARRALGLAEIVVEAPPPAAAVPETDSAAIAGVRIFLHRCYRAALSMTPAGLEEEARRMALASRLDKLPRLAARLRRLAGQLAELRQRTPLADANGVLVTLAETEAMCAALQTSDPALRAALGGADRAQTVTRGPLDLFGLGARLWETQAGARGVTAHFYAPSEQADFSVTLARPDRSDTQFNPAVAFREAPVWGKAMADLAHSQVTLETARITSGSRLSPSVPAICARSPWTPDRIIANTWQCAFDDWSALERYLRDAFVPLDAGGMVGDVPVILMFSRWAKVQYDQLTQTLIWPLADANGRWVGLTLDDAGFTRTRIDTLVRVAGVRPFWGVSALAVRGEDRFDLQPFALIGAETVSLDFAPPAGRDAPPVGLHDLGRPGLMIIPRQADGILRRAWNALLVRAERGAAGSREAFQTECGTIAEALATDGYATAARQFRTLAGIVDDDAEACLRAAFVVGVLRLAQGGLAWMRRNDR